MQNKFSITNIDIITSENFESFENFNHIFMLSKIYPIQRRRLSVCSKCIFSLFDNYNINGKSIIFSSTKGEINRCLSMMKILGKESIVSPTSFSLSVLNATPALAFILNSNHNEISAISSKSFIEYGIINAINRLNEGEKTVTTIFYEEEEDLNNKNESFKYFAMLLELSKDDEYEISFDKSSNEPTTSPFLSALNFYNKKDFWQINDGELVWSIKKIENN